jgi:gluconokinase
MKELIRTYYVLTIDIGSSSVRVLLFDSAGRVVEGIAAQERYSLRSAADGSSVDDADTVIERVARCIDAALQQAGPLAAQIGAVAVDTLVGTMLVLDVANQPLTPLLSYADTRSADDADRLRTMLDETVVHARTGCLLRASYWPARLAWLRRTQPDIWAQAARFVTLGEYLELRLFGSCRVSYSVASWNGLLNRHRLAWDAVLCELLGVDMQQFSPLVDHDAPQQGLRDEFVRRWPVLADIPWYPAVGDGAAANVGSGCTSPARVALTLGTTAALRIIQPGNPPVPNGLWAYRVDGAHALLGGATSEGGNVFQWLRVNLKLDEAAVVEAQLAAIAPDSHGLTMLPFLAGERSPGWAGDVSATIHGLTMATTPTQIVRASLEAVAYRCALIADLLGVQAGAQQLIASGGALRDAPTWCQILADAIGVPLILSAEPEATSRGVALLALKALGQIDRLDALPAAEGHVFAPDPDNYARYRVAMARQQRLYAQLIGTG